MAGWTASPKARHNPINRRVLRIDYSFPKRDGIIVGTRSGQREFQQLWLHFFAEGKVLCTTEVLAALHLAVNKHIELMIPCCHVADVDPLHAALAQGFELFGGVDVVRDELAIDLEPHAVEAHAVALGHRDEDRDLCPGRDKAASPPTGSTPAKC